MCFVSSVQEACRPPLTSAGVAVRTWGPERGHVCGHAGRFGPQDPELLFRPAVAQLASLSFWGNTFQTSCYAFHYRCHVTYFKSVSIL